jgi:hypothetical protein
MLLLQSQNAVGEPFFKPGVGMRFKPGYLNQGGEQLFIGALGCTGPDSGVQVMGMAFADTPFDEEPYDDDVPTQIDRARDSGPDPDRTPPTARPLAKKQPSIPDYVAAPAIREMPHTPASSPVGDHTNGGVAGPVPPAPRMRHRVYIALAFAAGLSGGLLVIVIALMIFGD